jgi:hypothetical protein
MLRHCPILVALQRIIISSELGVLLSRHVFHRKWKSSYQNGHKLVTLHCISQCCLLCLVSLRHCHILVALFCCVVLRHLHVCITSAVILLQLLLSLHPCLVCCCLVMMVALHACHPCCQCHPSCCCLCPLRCPPPSLPSPLPFPLLPSLLLPSSSATCSHCSLLPTIIVCGCLLDALSSATAHLC